MTCTYSHHTTHRRGRHVSDRWHRPPVHSTTEASPCCCSTPPPLLMQHTDAGFTKLIGCCTRAFATVDAGMLTAASSLVEVPLRLTPYDVQLVILPRTRLGMTTDGNVGVVANSRSLLTLMYIFGSCSHPSLSWTGHRTHSRRSIWHNSRLSDAIPTKSCPNSNITTSQRRP